VSSTPENSPVLAYATARDELIRDVAALTGRLQNLGDGIGADWSDVRTLHRLQDLVLEATRVARGMREVGST
jgi:hypothetical protein